MCSEASADKARQDGFYVGYKKMKVVSKSTGEQFPMVLVYPTETPSERVRFGPFEMELSIGSKIAEGEFPLAIISHGSGGTNLGYRSIAKRKLTEVCQAIAAVQGTSATLKKSASIVCSQGFEGIPCS